jgi:hypothetical protein
MELDFLVAALVPEAEKAVHNPTQTFSVPTIAQFTTVSSQHSLFVLMEPHLEIPPGARTMLVTIGL